jgi:hypothetical protein
MKSKTYLENLIFQKTILGPGNKWGNNRQNSRMTAARPSVIASKHGLRARPPAPTGCTRSSATTRGAELSALRDHYAQVKAASAATPKVGLMKLRPQPGERRYAVALRDGANLLLTLWVRSPKGDVYVLYPRADGPWNSHASYHREPMLHSKSFGHKSFVRSRQS